jgi:hypothetical protein
VRTARVRAGFVVPAPERRGGRRSRLGAAQSAATRPWRPGLPPCYSPAGAADCLPRASLVALAAHPASPGPVCGFWAVWEVSMAHGVSRVSDSGGRGFAREGAQWDEASRASLYDEVTQGIIAQLEAGIFPWVQPWSSAKAGIGLPRNAGSGRAYSGINVLILWGAVIEAGYPRRPSRRQRLCRTLRRRPASFPPHCLAGGLQRAVRCPRHHPRSCCDDGVRSWHPARLGCRRSLEHR